MDNQGTEIFVGIYKAIKRDSVFKKKSNPMIPHVSQVAQDQREEDRYMLTSFYVTR